MTYEQALQIAIEQLDDAVDYLRAMNKGFPKAEKQIEEYASASDVLKEMQAKREWVGLTEDEIEHMVSFYRKEGVAYAAEAKLKEKNA